MSKGIELLLDGNRGIYIPKDFVTEMDLSQFSGISQEDIEICSAPDHEWYWEAWDAILQDATYTDKDGYIWTLWQDGDLWLICEELMTSQEKRDFFGPGVFEEEEAEEEETPPITHYTCLYCSQEIAEEDCSSALLPEVDDVPAWEEIARYHRAECEWVDTRALRLLGEP